MNSKYTELLDEGTAKSQARESVKNMTLSDYLGEATADRMFNKSSSTNSTKSFSGSEEQPVDDSENVNDINDKGNSDDNNEVEDDNDEEVSNQIKKIASLAGINETTVSGNIASSPSIVGDTSDSHKPTVQLRRDNREKKEVEDEKKGKSKPKKVSANTSQIFKKVN